MEYSTPELIVYVREQLAAGFTRSALESTLITAGWSSDAVEETFRLLVEQHKTTTPEPFVMKQEPITTPDITQSSPVASTTVSNQLDQMLAGDDYVAPSTQPIQATQESVSATPIQTSAYSMPVTQQIATEPLPEPFIDTPAMQEVITAQENNSVQANLSRDTDIRNQIAYGIPDGETDSIISMESQIITKPHHHWWQILILVVLILVTLALLLLVLHALNVYDALSIDTPLWADTILHWIQKLIPMKA